MDKEKFVRILLALSIFALIFVAVLYFYSVRLLKSFQQPERKDKIAKTSEVVKITPKISPKPTEVKDNLLLSNLQNNTQTQFRTRFFPGEWETETNTKWGYEFIYPPEFELVRHNEVGEDILDMITLDLRRFGKPEPVFQVKIVNSPLVSEVRALNDARVVHIGKTEALQEQQITEDKREVLNYYIGKNLEQTIILTAYLASTYPTTTGLTVGYNETIEKILESFKILDYGQ